MLEILTRGNSKSYFSRKRHLRPRLKKAEGEWKKKNFVFPIK
jgi:hypothetical protein